MVDFAVRLARPIARLRWPRFLVAALLVAAVVASGLSTRALLHRGETMPGVRFLGTDVGGVPATDVGARVRAIAAARLAAPVPLAVGGETVTIPANRLFTLDRRATARAALDAGRGSWTDIARALLSPLASPPEVAPVLVRRPAATQRLRALLRAFGRPSTPARVTMNGPEPVVTPSRQGVGPQLEPLLDAIARRVGSGSGTITVRFGPERPQISDAAASEAARAATTAVSAPVQLTLDGRSLGSLTRAQLARLLRFEPRGARLSLALATDALARVLDPRVAPWKRRALNARFAVDGRRVRILPSRHGLSLDAAAAARAIVDASLEPSLRLASLRMRPLAPERTLAEARALGIRERVSTFTTDMGVSSSNRIHNVQLMARYIDGTIIRPGETFSFNRAVGPRTPERGFLEGQMIVGSLLLPSIGGGVCQTATTLFNNAFELGLPIVERHNHSFYISHYPLGRDATVSWGGPDFVFRNDMHNALLIKAVYTSSTLTFSFYGTDEGRRVTSRTSPKTNWREPKLAYALDPAAPPGSMRVESGDHQAGFDVTVFRTVEQDGKVLRKDSFESRYIPVGDTAIYGPGQSVPRPYFVIPRT